MIFRSGIAVVAFGGLSLSVLLVVGFGVSGFASLARAVPPDHNDEALREMCEHGLSITAADYCSAQVALNSERAPQRARWTMRRMECLCQAALAGRSGDPTHWQAVAAVEGAYRREFADDARLPWLAWQLARADLLQAQQAVADWLATPAADKPRDTALQAVRRTLSRLDDVEADMKQRLPLSQPRGPASRDQTGSSQAPSSELHALSVDCTLLRCEALLVRARCYPLASPDRLAALADVDRIAGEMLRRAPQEWSARDELLVARASAGLEVGQRAESKRVLLGVLNEQPVEAALPEEVVRDSAGATSLPSPRARLRAGSTLIDALCADKELAAAQGVLQTLEANFNGPEVELAKIVFSLASLEAQPGEQRAAELKRVIDHSQRLGQQYGGYWRCRAEALLVGSVSSEPTSGGASDPLTKELVTAQVRQLLAGGQTQAAVAKLRSASENARATARSQESLEFALQAAALLQRDKQWLAAADVLDPAALASPESTSAAAAHALAAWCLAQALKAEPQNNDLQQRYERTLREQLQRWPDAPESRKAEDFLTAWLDANKRFAELAAMWRERAERAGNAEAKARALGQWLDTLLGKLPVAQTSSEIDQLVHAIGQRQLAGCERTAILTALAAAMLTAPLTQTEAEALTNLKLPPHAADESISERALLSGLLALAAASRGDSAACLSALHGLPSEQLSPVVLLVWCKSIVEALDELTANQIAAWSEIAGSIPWPEAPATERAPAMRMTELRLRMLRTASSSDRSNLLAEIKQLVDENSRDARLQLSYAAALAQSSPQSFDDAVRVLKRVAIGSSPESEVHWRARWLEIRWRIARGETTVAAQIAALVLTNPNLPTVWWKARFESIAR